MTNEPEVGWTVTQAQPSQTDPGPGPVTGQIVDWPNDPVLSQWTQTDDPVVTIEQWCGPVAILMTDEEPRWTQLANWQWPSRTAIIDPARTQLLLVVNPVGQWRWRTIEPSGRTAQTKLIVIEIVLIDDQDSSWRLVRRMTKPMIDPDRWPVVKTKKPDGQLTRQPDEWPSDQWIVTDGPSQTRPRPTQWQPDQPDNDGRTDNDQPRQPRRTDNGGPNWRTKPIDRRMTVIRKLAQLIGQTSDGRTNDQWTRLCRQPWQTEAGPMTQYWPNEPRTHWPRRTQWLTRRRPDQTQTQLLKLTQTVIIGGQWPSSGPDRPGRTQPNDPVIIGWDPDRRTNPMWPSDRHDGPMTTNEGGQTDPENQTNPVARQTTRPRPAQLDRPSSWRTESQTERTPMTDNDQLMTQTKLTQTTQWQTNWTDNPDRRTNVWDWGQLLINDRNWKTRKPRRTNDQTKPTNQTKVDNEIEGQWPDWLKRQTQLLKIGLTDPVKRLLWTMDSGSNEQWQMKMKPRQANWPRPMKTPAQWWWPNEPDGQTQARLKKIGPLLMVTQAKLCEEERPEPRLTQPNWRKLPRQLGPTDRRTDRRKSGPLEEMTQTKTKRTKANDPVKLKTKDPASQWMTVGRWQTMKLTQSRPAQTDGYWPDDDPDNDQTQLTDEENGRRKKDPVVANDVDAQTEANVGTSDQESQLMTEPIDGQLWRPAQLIIIGPSPMANCEWPDELTQWLKRH